MGDAKWLDITELTMRACTDLKAGEMLHAKTFTLHEAMSALEMFVPKMDAGAGCKTDTAESLVASGALTFDFSSRSACLAIFDRLLVCEAMWLDGRTIVQSIFSCYYLHRIDWLPHGSLMRAFVLALLRSCDLARAAIMRGDLFYEEDFCPDMYGFSLAVEPSDAQLAQLLADAVASLRGPAATPEDEALAVRLEYRAHFLQLQLALAAEGSARASVDWGSADAHAATLAAKLDAIRASHVPDCAPPAAAFDVEALIRLIAPTPPFLGGYITTEAALTALAAYAAHVRQALSLCCLPPGPRLVSLDGAICRWAERPEPGVLVRSQLYTLACGAFFLGSTTTPLDEACAAMLVEECCLSDAAGAAVRKAQAVPGEATPAPFCDQAARALRAKWHAMLSNVARRQRALLPVLDSWSNVQLAAAELEERLGLTRTDTGAGSPGSRATPTQGALADWALCHTVQCVIEYLRLGFALDLYAHDELAALYWQLDFYYAALLEALTALSQRRLAQLAQAIEQTESKKKRALREAARAQFYEAAQLRLLGVSSRRALACGLFRVLVGAAMDGRLAEPTYLFGTAAARFQVRFAPLMYVYSPHYLSYDAFVTSCMRDGKTPSEPKKVFAAACETLQHCQKSLATVSKAAPTWMLPSELDEIKTLLRAAVTAGLAAQMLERGQAGRLNASSFDFSKHAMFPCLKLVA